MPKLNSLDNLEREVLSSGGWSLSNDRLSRHIEKIKCEIDERYLLAPLDKYGRVVNVGDWLRIDGFEKAFIVRGYELRDDVWEVWDSANGHTHACNECYHVGERPLEDVLAEFGDRYAALVSLHSPQAEKETLIAGYADELENISGKVAELDAYMMKSDTEDMQKLVQDKEAQITELEERCAKMSQWAHNVEELLAKTCREARGKVYEAQKAKVRVEALERLVRDMWFENLAHAYERCSWCTADCSGDYECDFSRRIDALGIEK